MSGFEVTGIVLGTFPNVISAVEHYRDFVNATLSPSDRSALNKLRNRLATQLELFDGNLRSLLLSLPLGTVNAETLFPTPNNGAIWATPEIAEIGQALRLKLGLRYELFMYIIDQMERLMKDLIDQLDVDKEGKPRQSTRKALKKFTKTSSEEWMKELELCNQRIEKLVSATLSKSTLIESQLMPSSETIVWWSNVKIYAGAIGANYSIGPSGLPLSKYTVTIPGRGFGFGKASIASPFERFPADAQVESQLDWIEDKYVVFWDSKDQRGWLIRGESALYHIASAAIHRGDVEETHGNMMAENSPTVQTAPRALSNPLILVNGMEIRDKPPEEDFQLQGYAEKFAPILGRLMDRQLNLSARTAHLNDYLEGWDFDDIVTRRTEIHSRTTKIKRSAKSWIKFCKDISALIVFGSGFGEIIRPTENNKTTITRPEGSKGTFRKGAPLRPLATEETQPRDRISPLLEGEPYLVVGKSDLVDIKSRYSDKWKSFNIPIPSDISHTGAAVFGFVDTKLAIEDQYSLPRWIAAEDLDEISQSPLPTAPVEVIDCPSTDEESLTNRPSLQQYELQSSSISSKPARVFDSTITGESSFRGSDFLSSSDIPKPYPTLEDRPEEALFQGNDHRPDIAPVGPTPSLYEPSAIESKTEDAIFELLLELYNEDHVLGPLFEETRAKVEQEKAIRNLRHFIDGYCVLLREQSPTHIQSRAIQFLRHRSRRFAEYIYGYGDEDGLSEQSVQAPDRAMEAEIKKQRTSEFVERLISSPVDSTPNGGFFEHEIVVSEIIPVANDNGNDMVPVPVADDADADDLYHNLSEIKKFLVGGEPMRELRTAYRNYIEGSSVVAWEAKVEKRVHQANYNMAAGEPTTIDDIKKFIKRSLPSNIEESTSSMYESKFAVMWDPVSFIKEQQYDCEGGFDIAIEMAITLTGTEKDAQALPCSQYMKQIWPTSGSQMIQLVKDVVRNSGKQCACILPDGLFLKSWTQDSLFVAEVSGTQSSIADVGVQLAWLGAALRSSSHKLGIATCTPYITATATPNEVSTTPILVEFQIDFTTKEPETRQKFPNLDVKNGECWHNMFRNPTVVRGYPIPPKIDGFLGLEIPLNMMVGLVQTKRINNFDGKIFLKGFSSMLVPTKRTRNLVVWHLLYHNDSSRISYLESTMDHIGGIEISEVEEARHVVGWCANVKLNAGAKEWTYNVDNSALPPPSPGCVLEKVSINGGKFVTIGATFAAGNRDKPLYLPQSRDTYLKKIDWITDQNFVFWDEIEKRGWLVNGSSALLHLLRSSLQHEKSGNLASSYMGEPETMGEASQTHRPDSALKVLSDFPNRMLKIRVEKAEPSEEWTTEEKVSEDDLKSDTGNVPKHTPEWTIKKSIKFTYYTVENKVEDIYNLLEQMLDDQAKIAKRAGIQLQAHGRKFLEGWAFYDVAKCKASLQPHMTKLPAVGKGWVDFIRDIQAVILFGQNFGEIIQPQPAHEISACFQWMTLPKDKYYLAACLSDLNKVMTERKLEFGGNSEACPPKLTKNIIWHTPKHIFEICHCQIHNTTGDSHSSPIQTLLPNRSTGKWERLLRLNSLSAPHKNRLLSENDLKCPGAVVFGHNYQLKWHYGDTGDPVPGTPPPEEAEDQISANEEIDTNISFPNADEDSVPSTELSTNASIGTPEYETTSTSATSTQENTPIASSSKLSASQIQASPMPHARRRRKSLRKGFEAFKRKMFSRGPIPEETGNQ